MGQRGILQAPRGSQNPSDTGDVTFESVSVAAVNKYSRVKRGTNLVAESLVLHLDPPSLAAEQRVLDQAAVSEMNPSGWFDLRDHQVPGFCDTLCASHADVWVFHLLVGEPLHKTRRELTRNRALVDSDPNI